MNEQEEFLNNEQDSMQNNEHNPYFDSETASAPAYPKADNSEYYQDHVAEFRSSQSGVQNGQYNYNPYMQQEPMERTDSSGSTMRGFGLGLGIVSILLTCVAIGIIPGIVGIILSNLGNKRGSTGVGTAGLVCSIIGTVLNAITLVSGILFWGALYTFFSAF